MFLGAEGAADMIEKTTAFNIFGKELCVKNYKCSHNGCPYVQKDRPLKMQLSLRLTSYCGASCRFCSAACGKGIKDFLNLKYLETVLNEMKRLNAVRGISITGGEPFTDIGLLNEAIEMIFDILGVWTEVSINTNGIGLKDIHKIKRLKYVDTVHISRHHYDDEKNRAYFGIDVPDSEAIKEAVQSVYDPRIFVLNCLLLKGGIGSSKEMKNYLEWAGDIGIKKAGFITAMPVNDYAAKNRVSYKDIFVVDEAILYTDRFDDFEYCNCRDGIYASSSGRVVEFYGRETGYGGPDFVRGFVLGPDGVLRTGYGEKAGIVADLKREIV